MSKDRTDKTEETASEWLIKRDSGNWTPDDEVRFGQWLDAATLHRVTFLRLELAWEESRRLKALGAGIPGDLPPPPGQWNTNTLFFRRRTNEVIEARRERSTNRGRRIAAVASVLLAFAAFGAYQFRPQNSESFTTQIGGLEKVPMLDGSQITLNTNSELRIALSRNERRIDLERGEAFFEVAHDADRPFVVEVGGKRVVAVGTKFSVRRNGESVEVVVTEGKVRMEPSGAGETAFLVAGDVGLANQTGMQVVRMSVDDAETRLSWREGVLSFRDMPLAEAVAEFNRYNVRKILIADAGVAAMRVEGNFRPTNVQAFVRLLESGFPIRVSVTDERIVLGSR